MRRFLVGALFLSGCYIDQPPHLAEPLDLSDSVPYTDKAMEKAADVRVRIHDKDWIRWNDYFIGQGYAPDEAALKASRMTAGE